MNKRKKEPMTTTKKDWEKEFDKLYGEALEQVDCLIANDGDTPTNNIKRFIRSLLLSSSKRRIKREEGKEG